MKEDKCCWPRCKQWADMNYIGKLLCWNHWLKFCQMEDEGKEKQARNKIKLKENYHGTSQCGNS